MDDIKVLTKVVVGSRLHQTSTPESDWDYRGIHISPLKSVLSPFRKQKNTSWIEGDEDNTSYELAEFCRLATKGNATILEVFFSDQVVETGPIAEEMRANWKKFIDTHHFVNASKGYAKNQWNKFYNFEDEGAKGQSRTAKFAISFIRVMWQCEQFLLTGEFRCSLKDCDYYDLIMKIKKLTRDELQPYWADVVIAIDNLERRVAVAQSESKFMGMKPDLEWVEDFIYRAYLEEGTNE